MKVLFVGHTDNSLSQIATLYNESAYLVTSDNYYEFLSSNSGVGFTSLGDMPIDTNIFYSSFDDPNNRVSDLKTAVEIKAQFHKSLDELRDQFPFQRVRFSKYCRGFNLLFNK